MNAANKVLRLVLHAEKRHTLHGDFDNPSNVITTRPST